MGSVGLRVGAVEGETVGETLVNGFGEAIGLIDRSEREANVRNNAPVMDAVLGRLRSA